MSWKLSHMQPVIDHRPRDQGVQWLSGRVLDSRPRGREFETHRHHCVVSLSKNINPSLVLVQPRKTCPFITERLLMGCKESNQTNKTNPKSTLQKGCPTLEIFTFYVSTTMPTEPVPEASETFFGLVLLWRRLPELPFKELGPVLQNFDLKVKYSTIKWH